MATAVASVRAPQEGHFLLLSHSHAYANRLKEHLVELGATLIELGGGPTESRTERDAADDEEDDGGDGTHRLLPFVFTKTTTVAASFADAGVSSPASASSAAAAGTSSSAFSSADADADADADVTLSPVMAAGFQSLLGDWRLWEAARPAHMLHAVTHVEPTWGRLLAATATLSATPYRLAVHPPALLKRLIAELPASVELHPKAFTRILHVVALPGGRFGFGTVPAHWHPTTLPGRRPQDAKPKHASRAFYKMREAAERWPALTRGLGPPTPPPAAGSSARPLRKRPRQGDAADGGVDDRTRVGGAALDLGAAPGGWTEWLVTDGRAEVCVAVDPGALSQVVGKMRGVTHLREKAEVAMESGRLAEAAAVCGGIDLVVSDMNMDPRAASRLVESVAPVLKDDAMLLLTLKMVKRGAAAGRSLEAEARKALEGHWVVGEVRQLFSNGRHERTLVATRRAADGSATGSGAAGGSRAAAADSGS